MFGHQDDAPAQKAESNTYVATGQLQEQSTVQPVVPAQYGSDDNDNDSTQPDMAMPTPSLAKDTTDDNADDQGQAWQHPGTPLDAGTDDDAKQDNKPGPIDDVISPAGGYPKRTSYQYGSGNGNNSDASDPLKALNPKIRELFTIKEEALDELEPLIDKLDLPPEEKFPALMMIIQTTDDQDLIKAAYNTAHAIKDDKTRARALLDIVNEINYFTAPQDDQLKPDEEL